jgi:hypothetical protein
MEGAQRSEKGDAGRGGGRHFVALFGLLSERREVLHGEAPARIVHTVHCNRHAPRSLGGSERLELGLYYGIELLVSEGVG